MTVERSIEDLVRSLLREEEPRKAPRPVRPPAKPGPKADPSRPRPKRSRWRTWQGKNALAFRVGAFACSACGVEPPRPSLHLHHVVPLAKGGTDDLSNLRLLCARCHRAEHAK